MQWRNRSSTPTSLEVTCPRCWDRFRWPDDDPVVWVHEPETAAMEERDLDGLDPRKKSDVLKTAYRVCPNPSTDSERHFIPATYADFQSPLAIGFVGAPFAGKTHLLAAMIKQAYAGELEPYGLQVGRLDPVRHNRFRRTHIERLEMGLTIEGTERGVMEYADILVLRRIRDGKSFAVVFFDIAGEDLRAIDTRGQVASRFLVGAPALIFAHPAGETISESENVAFGLTIDRLSQHSGHEQLPAAIALTKADALRFVPPIDRWIGRPLGTLDPATLHAESRDVYSYMHSIGAHSSLQPFAAFNRCTLHAVSATGGDAVLDSEGKMVFARGFQPARVLGPLVSILAMKGIIDHPDAASIGMP